MVKEYKNTPSPFIISLSQLSNYNPFSPALFHHAGALLALHHSKADALSPSQQALILVSSFVNDDSNQALDFKKGDKRKDPVDPLEVYKPLDREAEGNLEYTNMLKIAAMKGTRFDPSKWHRADGYDVKVELPFEVGSPHAKKPSVTRTPNSKIVTQKQKKKPFRGRGNNTVQFLWNTCFGDKE